MQYFSLNRSGLVFILLGMGLGLLLVGGCATQSQGLSLMTNASNYDPVFEGTISALRGAQFRMDRVDRRLGVIATRPRDSASIFEPWRGDNATVALAMESTIQHQRRRIRIHFRPAAASAERTANQPANMTQVTANPPPFEPASYKGRLRIDIECWIDRLHRTGRRIETSSLRFSRNTVDPSLQARGIPSSFWEPVGRDPLLEDQIARLIANSVGTDLVEVRAREADLGGN